MKQARAVQELAFRVSEGSDGVAVWLRCGENGAEIGPITLNGLESALLGSFVERATQVLEAALQRQETAVHTVPKNVRVSRPSSAPPPADGAGDTPRRLKLVR